MFQFQGIQTGNKREREKQKKSEGDEGGKLLSTLTVMQWNEMRKNSISSLQFFSLLLLLPWKFSFFCHHIIFYDSFLSLPYPAHLLRFVYACFSIVFIKKLFEACGLLSISIITRIFCWLREKFLSFLHFVSKHVFTITQKCFDFIYSLRLKVCK